jgi:hypothetical protein
MSLTFLNKECCTNRTLKRLYTDTDNNSTNTDNNSNHTSIELVKEEEEEIINTTKVYDPNADIGWALKPTKIDLHIINPKKLSPPKLVDDEDYITKEEIRIRKMTPHELGWAIRLGKVKIPKGYKRVNCKYYDNQINSCKLYNRDTCFNCKKKNLEKATTRHKSWLKRFENDNSKDN